MYIVGIDPSLENCGIAALDGQNLTLLCFTAYGAIRWLIENKDQISRIVIEDNDGVSSTWHYKAGESRQARDKTAENVGKGKGAQIIIEQAIAAEMPTVAVKRIRPNQRDLVVRKDTGTFLQIYKWPTKTTSEQFLFLCEKREITIINSSKVSPAGNKDSRDAATLII